MILMRKRIKRSRISRKKGTEWGTRMKKTKIMILSRLTSKRKRKRKWRR